MEAGEPRKITIGLSALPFVVAVISLFTVLFILKLPIYLALLAGWITAFVISLTHGYALQSLFRASYEGMKSTFIVVTILILIGGVLRFGWRVVRSPV